MLGPGRGESVVVHLGAGEWLIADCCIKRAGGAAPLDYLASIGVPATAVTWLVATHWHDDHVRGFGHLVRQCASARVAQAAALQGDEFLTLLAADEDLNIEGSSGVHEMLATLNTLAEAGRGVPEFVRAEQRLVRRVGSDGVPECEVWALSPSNAAVVEAMRDFGQWAPQVGATRRVVPRPDRNAAAVVLHVRVGAVALLLGADLEIHPSPDQGWQAIVLSDSRPVEQAHFVKVPHHGSNNAHDDAMWQQLLVDQPHAALTPFTSGSTPLPRDSDQRRIAALTPNAWLTRTRDSGGAPGRPRAVERTIRSVARSIEVVSVDPGRVTMRCPADGSGSWTVDAPSPAVRLTA